MSKILFAVSIIIVSLANISFDTSELGRIGDLTDEGRKETWDIFLSFLSNPINILVGNTTNELYAMSMGHNTFLDSIRQAGIIGGIIHTVLFLMIFRECMSFLWQNKSNIHYLNQNLFAESCLIFMIYSFTHSQGIQTGSVFFWLLYSLFSTHKYYYDDSK